MTRTNATRTTVLAWAGAAVVVVGLAIPWFAWGTATTVAGLPLWVWWHVGWLCLTAVAFRAFATRAWGIGVESLTPPAGSDRTAVDRGRTGTAAGAAGAEGEARTDDGERGGEARTDDGKRGGDRP